jgi:hypothetical protein
MSLEELQHRQPKNAFEKRIETIESDIDNLTIGYALRFVTLISGTISAYFAPNIIKFISSFDGDVSAADEVIAQGGQYIIIGILILFYIGITKGLDACRDSLKQAFKNSLPDKVSDEVQEIMSN